MERNSIIRKVLAKLDKKESMTTEEAMAIIFKDFVKKEEIFKPNYKKTIMLKDEQHKKLRQIYDEAPVKQLYTYSLGRFGFILEDTRFEVEPASVEIKREK
jgi:hypothetical protein